MTAANRLRRMVAACLTVVAATGAGAAFLPSPAGASEVVYLCGKSRGYDCMPGTGYTGQSVWGSHGPGHNCVSYVAYMLERNGSPRPWEGRLGNGSDWDEHARAAGYRVDKVPAVGSIAQWDGGSGHVAYVNSVARDHIVVTEDNYSGYTASRLIPRDSPTFAEAEFIHIRDLPPPEAADVIWVVDGATATTLWWGGPDAPLVPAPRGMPPENLSAREVATVGDFDGDGHQDLLLTEAKAARIAWGDGRGGFPDDDSYLAPADGRSEPVVADLDGDGADDILWYGRGQLHDEVWWGRVGQRRHDVGPALFDADYIPAAGDFDGDGIGDVMLIGPGGRPDRAIWGEAGSRTLVAIPLPPAHITPGAVPVVGDFDGDGRDDVIWTKNATPSAPLWWGGPTRSMEKRGVSIASDRVAHAGDFDGDGHADLLLLATGTDSHGLLQGQADRQFTPLAAPPPVPGARVIVGDFGSTS